MLADSSCFSHTECSQDIVLKRLAGEFFTGTRTTIRLRIGERSEQVLDWLTPSCADGSPVPKVEISYSMGTSMDGARIFGRCEAILGE